MLCGWSAARTLSLSPQHQRAPAWGRGGVGRGLGLFHGLPRACLRGRGDFVPSPAQGHYCSVTLGPSLNLSELRSVVYNTGVITAGVRSWRTGLVCAEGPAGPGCGRQALYYWTIPLELKVLCRDRSFLLTYCHAEPPPGHLGDQGVLTTRPGPPRQGLPGAHAVCLVTPPPWRKGDTRPGRPVLHLPSGAALNVLGLSALTAWTSSPSAQGARGHSDGVPSALLGSVRVQVGRWHTAGEVKGKFLPGSVGWHSRTVGGALLSPARHQESLRP